MRALRGKAMKALIRKATKPFRLARNLVQNVRRDGLAKTVRLYAYRMSERLRDWQLGIRTTGVLDDHVSARDADCIDYEGMNYKCLTTVFRYLNPDPQRDVFLDYGCGKGRAVVVAATYPFRRVIGVELASDLSQIARDNVRRAEGKLKCRDVEIVTANAAEFEVPPEVTMVFLFNPFRGRVFAAVRERLRQSLRAAPRRLRVIYMHPRKEAEELAACDWLVKQAELSTADWDEVRLVAYESRSVQ